VTLLPAWPWFGCKAAIAPTIWRYLGNPPNLVDAFCGTCSIGFLRPEPGKVETFNDIFGFIPNALRALKYAPDAVAAEISWCPVSELDLHARHAALLDRMDEACVERLRADPKFFDVEIAAWWIWGQSCWIGSGFCDGRNRKNHKKPALCGHGGGEVEGSPKGGIGVFRDLSRQIPSLSGSDGSGVGHGRGVFATSRREDLAGYLRRISDRLGGDNETSVRITCHDYRQVLTPAVTISHGLTGVILDAPYGEAANRTKNIYAKDSLTVAAEAREWALENGNNPLLRIVPCGYEGEHEMPATWTKIAWKSRGGYGNQGGENGNARRERLWFSPHCLRDMRPTQVSLFGDAV
jgi:hypothetical protein